MQLHRLTADAYQRFSKQANTTRVTLLHPNSRYRTLMVAHLLNDHNATSFYYALGPDDINLASFIGGLIHDLARQHATFGRHTNEVLPEALHTPDKLLDVFVRDLHELRDDVFYLILDEYDRSDSADDIQHFMEKLSRHLPPQCRLIINSRTLPRFPWLSMIAEGRALMLDDDGIMQSEFYDIRGGSQQLEVYALGPGFVVLNDHAIDTWEGHLPRLLFFFALDRPVITRSEICQTFWPDLDSDQAVNVFHVTKRRLHKALSIDVLVHEDNYYRINPELDVHYDAMNFVSYLMQARDTSSTAQMSAWQRAVDTYRGPFLQGHQDAWILERRRDFQSGYLEALMSMAVVRLREERYEHAIGLYQRAIEEDSTREDFHRDLMRLYAHMGRRSEVAAHFQRLQEDTYRFGREPSGELIAFYNELMR
jgi:DNA-binding SARP family transcriptional activator